MTLPRSLIADIGGTNTRVALASGGALERPSIRKYRNAQYSGLDAVLAAYFDEIGQQDCEGACVALAGPVRGDRGTLTNLDWTLDTDILRHSTGAGTAALLNDLQAQGYGLLDLQPKDCVQVIKPELPAQGDTRLVINVGTGFNAVPVYRTGSNLLVPPSECGHGTLPVQNAEEFSLYQYIEQSHGFAAVEEVLSGRGLEMVFRWVAQQEGGSHQLSSAEIIPAGLNGTDPLARKTLEVFSRIFGSVSGDLALSVLPFGGVYLVGGVARALGKSLTYFGFSEGFINKGRFAPVLKGFSVNIVEDDYAALSGSARYLAALI
ncbi:MAG: glucokinase [Pseudomonadota bacterium]